MKIAYRLASGGGGYTTMADDTAVSVLVPPVAVGQAITPEFKPSFQSATQTDPLFRSPKSARFNRGNTVCTLPLEFEIQYATADDAMASILAYGALNDNLLHLQVTIGATIHYYPNALITSYSPQLMGASVRHSFVFQTDNVQATAP